MRGQDFSFFISPLTHEILYATSRQCLFELPLIERRAVKIRDALIEAKADEDGTLGLHLSALESRALCMPLLTSSI